jgi:glycosyltransferase involved in cell wall biosynthesis
MKILYIHQYFKTPKEPGGTRSYWFSKELVEAGINVVMITSRNNQEKLVEIEHIDGIEVVYVKNAYRNNFGIFRRLISFIRFTFLSSYIALKQKKVNLVYATSTPLTVGITAILIKNLKKINYFFEVRDLWPEVPIQMKGLKNPIAKKIAIFLEKIIYKKAHHIVALSPGMLEGVIKRGICINKVSMIPNMAKNDLFYSREKDSLMMKRLSLNNDKFYIIHFGAMGIANGLEYLLESALILEQMGEKDIVFLFVGEGGQKEKLKKIAQEQHIKNVRFLGQFNMSEMSKLVNISNCSIISFLNLPILETNSPNKLFDSLSAQKPIIVNSAGWTKDMVEKHNCGAYVNPDYPEELANLLIEWKKSPEKVQILGKNARLLAEEKYDKSILTKKFKNLILNYFNNEIENISINN